MSKTTKAREKALRVRPEVARLRATGGLSHRVVVDGSSVLRWCGRSKADYTATVCAIADAADAGRRALVLVQPPSASPSSLPAPHVVLSSALGVASLMRTDAAAMTDVPVFPSVIVADVRRERELLDIVSVGALNVLDIASGRLWRGSVADKYDTAFAAVRGNTEAWEVSSAGDALYAAVTTALSPRHGGQSQVVCALHRENGRVVLDRVGVDNGVRRYAAGHEAGLRLLHDVVATGVVPVMTSSMDVLDALFDAGEALPVRVEDPGLACVLLDPDGRSMPQGIGLAWNGVLSIQRDGSPVCPPLDLLLDELPAIHAELREALRANQLLPLYETDVCLTAPLFAAIEREGFYVDKTGLDADLALLEAHMRQARAVVLAGPNGPALNDLRNTDLVRSRDVYIGQRIRMLDGDVPPSWRAAEKHLLQRLALFGNARARSVEELRGLDAVAWWTKRLDGQDRMRSILVPGSTGRWYPHSEALASIPKYGPAAMRLREHFVPEPGHVFVSGDFAAFEPRLLAHQSGDLVLMAGCQVGMDIYQYLMPLLGVTDRDIMKSALLAFMYGRSAASFASALPLPTPDGHAIHQKLEKLLATALAFRQGVHRTDKVVGRSLYGWQRRRGTASPSQFKRRAFNLRMQGTAADLLRKLLRDLRAGLPRTARVVHQEFDAVILTCPEPDAQAVEATLKHTMENVATLTVPLVAKTKHGGTLAAVS
jgi:hypothetical protein